MKTWVLLEKNSHIWKNVSNLEEWVTLAKWVTLGKTRSLFEKRVALGKMGYTCKNGSHYDGSRLEKWVTPR